MSTSLASSLVSSPAAYASPPSTFGVAISFGSCLGVSPFADIRAFDWLFHRRHDRSEMVVLMGDTVYVDIPKLDHYVAYKQIWNDRAFRRLFGEIPFLGTYDDHEIVNDWSTSDGIEQYYDAMAFFDEFVAAKNPPPPPMSAASAWTHTPDSNSPPGARRRYFTFQRGRHVAGFVLDTRQYASPVLRGENATDANESSPDRTKLGPVQKADLFEWLTTTTATYKFIFSSVAWTRCAYKFVQDGWAAYRHERNEIFDFIRDRNITGVVLLSADLHWSGVFHFKEWNLYEITASPIQSFPLPHWILNIPNEEKLFSSAMYMHIGELRVVTDGLSSPTLNTTIWKYMYGQPKIAYSRLWNVHDFVPMNLATHNSTATR